MVFIKEFEVKCQQSLWCYLKSFLQEEKRKKKDIVINV